MQNLRIEGCTRTIGKSQGYLGLSLLDEVVSDIPIMTSAWEPTPAELARLNAGAPVIIRLYGENHPPIKVEVGEMVKVEVET